MTQTATFTDGEGSYLSDRWRLTGWPTNRDEHKNLCRDLNDFAVLTSGSLDAYLDILLSTTPYSDGPYITDLSAAIAYDLCDRRMKAINAGDQREVVRLNEAERDFRKDFPLQFSDEVWWTNLSTLLPEILQRKRPERIAAIVRALESAADNSPSEKSARALLGEVEPAAPKKKKDRGPRADNEGHRRVAAILRDGWEKDIPGSLQLLASPPDGGPAVAPSAAWQTKYKIKTYADVYETVGDTEIRKHLDRRYKCGQKLLGFSGNSR